MWGQQTPGRWGHGAGVLVLSPPCVPSATRGAGGSPAETEALGVLRSPRSPSDVLTSRRTDPRGRTCLSSTARVPGRQGRPRGLRGPWSTDCTLASWPRPRHPLEAQPKGWGVASGHTAGAPGLSSQVPAGLGPSQLPGRPSGGFLRPRAAQATRPSTGRQALRQAKGPGQGGPVPWGTQTCAWLCRTPGLHTAQGWPGVPAHPVLPTWPEPGTGRQAGVGLGPTRPLCPETWGPALGCKTHCGRLTCSPRIPPQQWGGGPHGSWLPASARGPHSASLGPALLSVGLAPLTLPRPAGAQAGGAARSGTPARSGQDQGRVRHRCQPAAHRPWLMTPPGTPLGREAGGPGTPHRRSAGSLEPAPEPGVSRPSGGRGHSRQGVAGRGPRTPPRTGS